jgi:Tfp pilus assembly protein PilZ/DNA-binding Xre family transcriptional regulator
MAKKIISKVKEVMNEKGITTAELRNKTSLPHVAISNACSARIEFTGLNILNKIASAMNVSIKDLFHEVDVSKQAAPKRKPRNTGDANISSVTNQLIKMIMEMSTTDKDKLLKTFNEIKKSPVQKMNTSNITTELIQLITKMSLEDRCKILGEFISYTGNTRRKYGRREFIRSVDFTVKGSLYRGYTKDISRGGVFIETKNANTLFSAGEPIKMNLEHPELHRNFNVTGKIIRTASSGIGVEFDIPL